MKKLLLIALSTFAMSANAWEPSFYVGSSLASQQFAADGIFSNFTVTSLELSGGSILAPYLSVEARLGVGLGEEQESAKLTYEPDPLRATMDLKTNFYGSIYLRPFVANDKSTFYALLGYTSVDFELSYPDGAVLPDTSVAAPGTVAMDGSEGGVSFGVGAAFKVNEHFNFTAEWKKTINTEDFSIRGGSIGFTYNF